MFWVNFSLLFVKNELILNYEDVDEPNVLLPNDFLINLQFTHVNNLELGLQWTERLKWLYIQLDCLKKQIHEFNLKESNFYF